MTPPEWFIRELKLIDPLYFVWWNDEYEYWEIKVKKEFVRRADSLSTPTMQVIVRAKNPTIDVVHSLDQRCLHNLRRRKFLDDQDARADPDRDPYLDRLIDRNKEAKRKKILLGREMVAEGLIKQQRMKTTADFDLGISYMRREAAVQAQETNP